MTNSSNITQAIHNAQHAMRILSGNLNKPEGTPDVDVRHKLRNGFVNVSQHIRYDSLKQRVVQGATLEYTKQTVAREIIDPLKIIYNDAQNALKVTCGNLRAAIEALGNNKDNNELAVGHKKSIVEHAEKLVENISKVREAMHTVSGKAKRTIDEYTKGYNGILREIHKNNEKVRCADGEADVSLYQRQYLLLKDLSSYIDIGNGEINQNGLVKVGSLIGGNASPTTLKYDEQTNRLVQVESSGVKSAFDPKTSVDEAINIIKKIPEMEKKVKAFSAKVKGTLNKMHSGCLGPGRDVIQGSRVVKLDTPLNASHKTVIAITDKDGQSIKVNEEYVQPINIDPNKVGNTAELIRKINNITNKYNSNKGCIGSISNMMVERTSTGEFALVLDNNSHSNAQFEVLDMKLYDEPGMLVVDGVVGINRDALNVSAGHQEVASPTFNLNLNLANPLAYVLRVSARAINNDTGEVSVGTIDYSIASNAFDSRFAGQLNDPAALNTIRNVVVPGRGHAGGIGIIQVTPADPYDAQDAQITPRLSGNIINAELVDPVTGGPLHGAGEYGKLQLSSNWKISIQDVIQHDVGGDEDSDAGGISDFFGLNEFLTTTDDGDSLAIREDIVADASNLSAGQVNRRGGATEKIKRGNKSANIRLEFNDIPGNVNATDTLTFHNIGATGDVVFTFVAADIGAEAANQIALNTLGVAADHPTVARRIADKINTFHATKNVIKATADGGIVTLEYIPKGLRGNTVAVSANLTGAGGNGVRVLSDPLVAFGMALNNEAFSGGGQEDVEQPYFPLDYSLSKFGEKWGNNNDDDIRLLGGALDNQVIQMVRDPIEKGQIAERSYYIAMDELEKVLTNPENTMREIMEKSYSASLAVRALKILNDLRDDMLNRI